MANFIECPKVEIKHWIGNKHLWKSNYFNGLSSRVAMIKIKDYMRKRGRERERERERERKRKGGKREENVINQALYP